MFNIDDIKKQATEKIQEKGSDISNKVLTLKENIGDSVESTKESVIKHNNNGRRQRIFHHQHSTQLCTR